MENDSDVVVEIRDDGKNENNRLFPFFNKKKSEEDNRVNKAPVKEEKMDMKVPFNNRYKYNRKHGSSSENAQFEENVVIENNLQEGNDGEKPVFRR